MKFRSLATGKEYEGDWLDVLAIGLFWVCFALAVIIILPFAIVADVRAMLAEIDAAKWETEP